MLAEALRLRVTGQSKKSVDAEAAKREVAVMVEEDGQGCQSTQAIKSREIDAV